MPQRQKWHPEPYQRNAAKFLVEREYAALFLDAGARKTSTMLAVLKILFKQTTARRALVLTTLNVASEAWPPEIDKWEDFAGLRYEVAHGKARESALRDPELQIVLMNFEGLPALVDKVPAKFDKHGNVKSWKYVVKPEFRGNRWPFDVLVVDESTKVKRASTDRFKRMKAFLPLCRRRYLLTGTPTPKGYMDLFGQVYCLDLGKSLGRYVTHYRARFFAPSGFGGFDWVIKSEEAKREIEALIAPFIHRVTVDLKLPPLDGAIGFDESEPSITFVDIPRETYVAYKKLERTLVMEVEGGTVTAKNAGVASMKCRQLANGAVYADRDPTVPAKRTKKRDVVVAHDAKLEALRKLLDEEVGDEPVIIAYEFEHDLARLRELLGDDLPYFGGGMDRKKFRATREAWNRGELRYLAVQPSSAAHGLNIQEAGWGIVFFAMIWDLELYIQLIKRLWRSGRKEPVHIRHLVARGTVDEDAAAALASKSTDQNGFLQAMLRRAQLATKRRR